MRIPKYAAQTLLTAGKITSAGASRPLFIVRDVSCLICCLTGCYLSHSMMQQMQISASVHQYLCGCSTCLNVMGAAW